MHFRRFRVVASCSPHTHTVTFTLHGHSQTPGIIVKHALYQVHYLYFSFSSFKLIQENEKIHSPKNERSCDPSITALRSTIFRDGDLSSPQHNHRPGTQLRVPGYIHQGIDQRYKRISFAVRVLFSCKNELRIPHPRIRYLSLIYLPRVNQRRKKY